MAIEARSGNVHVAHQDNMLVQCLEMDNVLKQPSVEFQFVVMACALDGPTGGVSVGVGGTIDPIAVDDDDAVGHVVNEQTTFQTPWGCPGHAHSGYSVVPNKGCNAMYLAAETGCVVLVRWEGKEGGVCMLVGQGTVVCRGLKATLSGDVVVCNLDLLQT